jgi:hypothetical protein
MERPSLPIDYEKNTNLNNKIKNNGKDWADHVERMEPRRIPGQTMSYASGKFL